MTKTTVIHVGDHKSREKAQKNGTYVYVGRDLSGVGEWGNRYSHLPSGVPGVVRVRTREEAIERHKRETLADPVKVERIKRELAGKVLGCWCHPFRCHSQTYADIANGLLP